MISFGSVYVTEFGHESRLLGDEHAARNRWRQSGLFRAWCAFVGLIWVAEVSPADAFAVHHKGPDDSFSVLLIAGDE